MDTEKRKELIRIRRLYLGLEHISDDLLLKFSRTVEASNPFNCRLIREEENRKNFDAWQENEKFNSLKGQWWMQ